MRRLVMLSVFFSATSSTVSYQYPACASDSDCYEHPMFRCEPVQQVKNLVNDQPAGICYGTTSTPCQCNKTMSERLCGPTPFKRNTSSSLPTYLMIGDSISFGMEVQGRLFDRLKGSTQPPVHNGGNAGNVNRGAHCVPKWADRCGTFDIISFNFGLHDIDENPEHLTLSEYTKLLTSVVRQLQACPKTKLLYVTTTAVATDSKNASQRSDGRLNVDVVAYNAAAKVIMTDANIPVLDLYAAMIDHCGEKYSSCDWQLPNNVHFQQLGWDKLASIMASAIEALAKKVQAEAAASTIVSSNLSNEVIV